MPGIHRESPWRAVPAAVLVLGCLSSGCSFVFVTPAPARVSQPAPHPHADCTSSRVAPVLDGILTGYELFRIGYAAQASDAAYRRSPIPRGTDLALGAVSAALFLSSAIYGVVNTSACHRLKHGPVLGEEMPGITREPEPELPASVDPALEPAPATKAQDAPASPPQTPAPARAAGGAVSPP